LHCFVDQEPFSDICTYQLSKDLLQQATTNFTEMLHLAENCFKMASVAGTACDLEAEVTSEKWLLHYLLGKIAEKLHESPSVYLDHYAQVILINFKLYNWHF
jgi:calcineurin-binding protein cabin-1